MWGLIFLAVFATFINVYDTRFIVHTFENCENPDLYLVKVSTSGIEKIKNEQYIKDLNATFNQHIGTNSKYVVKLYSGKSRYPLTLKGPNICEDVKMFLGEMWIILVKQLGMLDDSCPLKKGIYSGKHIFLDTIKIPFKVPFKGDFTVIANCTDTITKKPLVCIKLLVENI